MNTIEGSIKKPPVTRIAPSPTGTLHIGTARTALFNYLFAKKHKGTFILRFEDTDRERSKKEYEEDIREALQWLSLKPDKEVRQSDRSAIYAEYIQQLLNADKAYISKERSKKDSTAEIEVVRFKNSNPLISFTDTVRGEISVDISDLGDFVIARSITDPLYHLAVVVDDIEMGITHVLRGDDHIINTPRQIALIEALGKSRPVYTHIPLIHSPSGGKLSKRKDATAITEFRDHGYASESIVNTLALMGWNPKSDDEVFSLTELIENFMLAGIQKKEAVFNEKKMQWFHKQHVQRMSLVRLKKEIVPALTHRFPMRSRLRPKAVKALLHTMRERGPLFKEVRNSIAEGSYDFYFKSPEYKASLLMPKNKDLGEDSARNILILLRETHRLLAEIGTYTKWDEGCIQKHLWEHAERKGKALVLWPLRVALSGQDKSPSPFFIASVIGKRQTMRRIEKACAALEGILSTI